MIYSCTLFYNEFDLLKIKTEEELAGGVDKCIAVESSRTFQNGPKPLYLTENPVSNVNIIIVGDEFDRVMHDDQTIACFQREAIQRNAGVRGLDLKDDDVIIYADVDEIFPRTDIQKIVKAVRKFGFVHLLQRQFYYKLNLLSDRVWYGPFAVIGQFVKAGLTLNRLRTQESVRMPTDGKHFSYLMTPEQISQKIKSFSHCWFNTPKFTDTNTIQSHIQEGRDLFGRDYLNLTPVEIDNSYPQAILENLASWTPYIEENASKRILDVPIEDVPLMPAMFNEFNEIRYREINKLPC